MNTNTDKAKVSASMIAFAGEELSDWAARQPKIGPANDARIKAALETGFWLQEHRSLIVRAVNQHDALLAVAEAAKVLLAHHRIADLRKLHSDTLDPRLEALDNALSKLREGKE